GDGRRQGGGSCSGFFFEKRIWGEMFEQAVFPSSKEGKTEGGKYASPALGSALRNGLGEKCSRRPFSPPSRRGGCALQTKCHATLKRAQPGRSDNILNRSGSDLPGRADFLR